MTARQSLDALLHDERQATDRGDHEDAHRDGQGDRGPHADPDTAEGIAPVDLDQVGGDDPDDERGLEPFPERDEEGGGHGSVDPQALSPPRKVA